MSSEAVAGREKQQLSEDLNVHVESDAFTLISYLERFVSSLRIGMHAISTIKHDNLETLLVNLPLFQLHSCFVSSETSNAPQSNKLM